MKKKIDLKYYTNSFISILLFLIFFIFIISPSITYSAFVPFSTKIDTIQERINIQVVLNRVMVPSPGLVVDGVLGKKSIQAIQAFQESRGLVPDGKIGPITRSALESAQTNTTTTTYTTGCLPGALFNTIDGQPCTTSSTSLSAGCTGTNKFSTTTGKSCNVTTIKGGGGGGGGGSSTTTTTPICSGSTTQACTITNGTGSQSRTCNSGTWSDYGTCAPTSCNTGYTISSNICVITVIDDTVAPTVDTFVIPATSSSLTVSITDFTASDTIGVTGYLLTESATAPLADDAGWVASAPATYVFATEGTKTLYAWAKDLAGNVSTSLNDSVTISLPTPSTGDTLIINHTNTNINSIPSCWIENAKNMTLHYAHTSHGSQIISGLGYLETYINSLYNFAVRESTTEGLPEDATALRIYDGTLGGTYATGGLYWGGSGIEDTRTVASTGHYNSSMWSWCGEQSGNSVDTVNTYLTQMKSFEDEFTNMRFILMTGHTDGTGLDNSSATLTRNNQMLRNYATANEMVLFDFADIEAYDPDGNYYPSATDACTWCEDWCYAHPSDCQNLPSCAHSHGLICVQKAKAFWWMASRLSGWDGIATTCD